MKAIDTPHQQMADNKAVTTYQLIIKLSAAGTIEIGRLGEFRFPPGSYVYTGSAIRNLAARVNRHLSPHKTCHWHIDYFLAQRHAQIIDVKYSSMPECALNKQQQGEILVPRFGASDCRQGCGSHFKYLGSL